LETLAYFSQQAHSFNADAIQTNNKFGTNIPKAEVHTGVYLMRKGSLFFKVSISWDDSFFWEIESGDTNRLSGNNSHKFEF
jgi:hypothetical protein